MDKAKKTLLVGAARMAVIVAGERLARRAGFDPLTAARFVQDLHAFLWEWQSLPEPMDPPDPEPGDPGPDPELAVSRALGP